MPDIIEDKALPKNTTGPSIFNYRKVAREHEIRTLLQVVSVPNPHFFNTP